MRNPIHFPMMMVYLLLTLFLAVPSATQTMDLQSNPHLNDEAIDLDAIMGADGVEIMLDDTFLGTAWLYEYASREAMLEASEALPQHLKKLGYIPTETMLEELPAIRFTQKGKQNILIAPHADYPFVYVVVGKFTTDADTLP